MRRVWFAFVFVILMTSTLLFAAKARCQAVNGAVLGTITDSSGAAVAGAKITITEQNQNVSRSTTTNESGFYSVPDLPPGLYKVNAEKAGFKMVVRSNVEVSVSSTPHIDLTLQPGSVNETLTVEVTLPLLQTDSAQTGADLNSNIAEDLPVGNGSPFENF
jgi:uncharacterized surface anchored protein